MMPCPDAVSLPNALPSPHALAVPTSPRHPHMSGHHALMSSPWPSQPRPTPWPLTLQIKDEVQRGKDARIHVREMEEWKNEGHEAL